MKKQFIFTPLFTLFSFFVFLFPTVAQTVTQNNTDYCHFVGTINGNLPIVMDLTQNGNLYSGSYYYKKYNSPISLQGQTNKKGELELVATNNEGEKIEFIVGKISQNTFVGSWYNKDKSKKLPVSIAEDYSQSISFTISAVKDSIKLVKNKKNTPQAIFSDVIVDVKQVPQGSNLSKIKEILKKHQKITTQSAKQILENNKKTFFKDYLEVNKDLEEEYLYSANWANESNVNIIFNDAYFATLGFSNYQFSGGAHGMYGETYLVIDIKKSEKITLSSIFDKNALVSLEKRILKKAYAYTNSQNASSLQDAGYLVDKIEATENFSLTALGITFVYQPYEIAPYAAGMPTFSFTWDELKDIIRVDSSVNSLLKK